VTSLVREEVSKLKQDDTLTIFIDTTSKGFITFAIKTEELPVIYEETTNEDVTRFLIKLK
jgi:hypothetical protein